MLSLPSYVYQLSRCGTATLAGHILQGGPQRLPAPLLWPLLPRALLLPAALQGPQVLLAVPPALLPRPPLPGAVPRALLPAAAQGVCTACFLVLHVLVL